MFEVRQAGIKGFGIFATHQIVRGSRILAERPLLLVDHTETNILGAASRLSNAQLDTLTSLSVNQRKRSSLWNLADVVFQSAQLWSSVQNLGSDQKKKLRRVFANIQQRRDILACFYNNNFALSPYQHQDGATGTTTSRGVFPTIARLNHSCIPNAQGNFNSNVAGGSFTIHALRDIPAGEEITVSYLHDELALADERQRWLHEQYGFWCACPICSRGQQALNSSGRRRQLRNELAKVFTSVPNTTKPHLSDTASLGSSLSPVLSVSGASGDYSATAAAAAAAAAKLELSGPSQERLIIKLTIDTYEQEGLLGGELASLYGVAAGLAESVGDHGEALRLGARSMELERDATGDDSPVYQMRRRCFERLEFGTPGGGQSPHHHSHGGGVNTQYHEDDSEQLSYAPWT